MHFKPTIPSRASSLPMTLRTQTQMRLAMLRVRMHLRAVLALASQKAAQHLSVAPPRHVRPFRVPPWGCGVDDPKPSRRPLLEHQNALALAAQCPPEVFLG